MGHVSDPKQKAHKAQVSTGNILLYVMFRKWPL